MKKRLIITLLSLFLVLGIQPARAQSGPPSPPGSGGSGDSPGGGAPIGDGLVLLLTMGAAYGGFKGYKFWKPGKEK